MEPGRSSDPHLHHHVHTSLHKDPTDPDKRDQYFSHISYKLEK